MQFVCMKNREEKANYAKWTSIWSMILTNSQRRSLGAGLSDDRHCEQRRSPAIWRVVFCSGKQDGIREIADSINQFLLLTGATCRAHSCDSADKRGYNTYALLASYDHLENGFSPPFSVWIQSVISLFAKDSREKKYQHQKWILHTEVKELGQAQRKGHRRNIFVHIAKTKDEWWTH